MRYVALLRGINVGTSVQVPMKSLRSLLETLGFENVVTYLNSGNILFDAEQDSSVVAQRLEAQLAQTFGQPIPTLVKSAAEIIAIEQAIPVAWKNDATEKTYVAYLFDDIARAEIIAELPIKHEYMDIFYTHKAFIWNVRREQYHRSQIAKIATHPHYARMTTRNVNTARKLAALCREQ